MENRNCFRNDPGLCSRQVPGAPVELIREHSIEVFVNEAPAMRLTCTPEHLDELVVGRLLTEGLIASTDDTVSLYICEQGLRARVFLKEGVSEQLHTREEADVATCCTDNHILLQRDAQALPVLQPIAWNKAQIQRLSACIRNNAPLYERTHAVHSCFLGCGDEILCGREDIGRHNAVDKTIGWASLAGVDLTKCILFTTGRMPLDMVRKAIRARIPVLASKTYPTLEAVELAKRQGLTLLTLPPRGELVVWSGFNRKVFQCR